MRALKEMPETPVAVAVPAKVPYKPEIGDLYWGRERKFPGMDAGQEKSLHVLRDAAVGHSGAFLPFAFLTWPRLIDSPARLGIDLSAAIEESKYECPYTGRTHYALCPVVLLRKASEVPYRQHLGRHFAADPFFAPLPYGRSLDALLTDVARMDLGPGYTSECNHFDGSPGLEACYLDLDNGDRVLAAVQVWFNK